MKKFVLAVSVIATFSLFILNSAFSAPTHPNEIGLYTTPDGFGATGTELIGVPVDVYLVLTKPEAQNVPCSHVLAFECYITFNPAGGLFKLAEVWGDVGINIGDSDHIGDGYLEYIIGFANGIPVVDEAATLIHYQFMNINTVPVEVTLGPTVPSDIPGEMVFLPPDPPVEIMYSVGGSHAAPVFIFNGEAINVEAESFGSVKALYR